MRYSYNVIACDERTAFAQGALATKQSSFAATKLDCFASLAMTLMDWCARRIGPVAPDETLAKSGGRCRIHSRIAPPARR
jgi:hypothetical protein